MPRKVCLCFFLLLLLTAKSFEQNNGCTTLGQTPLTAFPVCGTSVFNQTQVPACGGSIIPVPGCPATGNAAYGDLNPFWYSFTCFTTGTLGFSITPNNLDDDYDWQLFDITGRNPNSVYTDPSLFVVGNWSGNSSLESSRGFTGVTGTSGTARDNVECATHPKELGGRPPYYDAPTFSKWPVITQGHKYLLLVSHFSGNNQSGYGLSFGGGTAVITDTTKPAINTAVAKCDGQVLYIKLNKRVKCATLANDGSDFYISPAVANVTSATGGNCSASFDMDSVVVTLDKPLKPGNYQIIIHNGSDDNTLLDICDNPISEFDSVPFIIEPLQPTPFDSIIPVSCAPNTLRFIFKNAMRCSSVAPDGSDFSISGSTPVSVVSAFGESCEGNGVSPVIDVLLNKPILTAGSYTVTLKKGSDGNTLIDECAQETPAGEKVSFATADTVSADFSYKLDLGCVYDTLFYAHDGKDQTNEWNWTFDTDGVSNARDSFFSFNDYGLKRIQLVASNGVCTDTSSANINLDNELVARFKIAPSPELCPEDVAVYTDSSIGKIVSWYWIFGDGTTSTLQNPPPKKYPAVNDRNGKYYPVALIVKNDINCFDTAHQTIKTLYNCYIAVPTAFTPNGDGLNDYLYPLNAYKAINLEFRVYNRYGQLVFETTNWTKKWDGTINGTPQGSGTYVWMLSYTDGETGKKIFQKGTSVLIR